MSASVTDRDGRYVTVLIWSGEHHAYWRPNSAGYTIDGLAAGVYEREEAERIMRGTGPDKKLELRPINPEWPILRALADRQPDQRLRDEANAQLVRDLDRHASAIYSDIAQSNLWSTLVAARDTVAGNRQPDQRGGEVKRLRHVIDRDRYIAAHALGTIRKAIAGRSWLREAGRGCYAYDDERYQREFGGALDEIEAALDPLARLAVDKSDCTTDPVLVQAARDAAGAALAAAPRSVEQGDR